MAGLSRRAAEFKRAPHRRRLVAPAWRHAASSAPRKSASSSADNLASVQPWRPQAPASGENACGAHRHRISCSSRVNLRFADWPSFANVAKIRAARNATRSKCGASLAPSRESAMRLRSPAVARRSSPMRSPRLRRRRPAARLNGSRLAFQRLDERILHLRRRVAVEGRRGSVAAERAKGALRGDVEHDFELLGRAIVRLADEI